MAAVRFWGTVTAVRARLVLTRFENERSVSCAGHLLRLEGTRQTQSETPASGAYTVAIGPATQERRKIQGGDLLRGVGYPVPDTAPDTPADLYRVGTLRVIARAGDPGAGEILPPDPPRTDPFLNATAAEAAPRRPLPDGQLAPDGVCAICPYGTVVAVVRLSDPRDFRRGQWAQVPACLGPIACPYYPPLPAEG